MLVDLASLADLRAVIGKLSDAGHFETKQAAAWQEGVEKFGKLRSRVSNWKARNN